MHLRAIRDFAHRHPGRAYLAVALLLAGVLYAPTLGYGLVGYDDTWLLQENWVVQRPSWDSLRTIFFELDIEQRWALAPEYLPIRDLSVMLDYAIWDDWYGGFHLTNLILYLAAIVAWFLALEGFGVDSRIAGLAVLLWAVHPAHAESVAWLAERKGLLAITFAGVAGIGLGRFRAGRSVLWLVLAMVATLAAVWSKAHGAFAVASLAILEVAAPQRVSWRRSLVGLGAVAAIGIAAFVPVVLLARNSEVIGAAAMSGGRLEAVLGIHGFYIQLAMLVHASSPSYPIASVGPSAIDIVVGAVGLIVLIGMIVAPRGRRWSPPLAVRIGAALWLIGWLPVSHLLVPLRMVVVADRYILFPTLGLALVVAASVPLIRSNAVRITLIAAIVAAASLRTLDARSSWRSPALLWERAVATNPRDGSAWGQYAEAVAVAGDPARAMAIVAEGRQHSNDPRLIMRHALLELQHGSRDIGVALMREAATAGDHRPKANLALLLLDDGHVDEALRWARMAVREAPLYAAGQRAFGKIALAAGQSREALAAFERAYALEPRRLDNRFNLALALLATDRGAEATPHLEACLSDATLGPRARALLQRR